MSLDIVSAFYVIPGFARTRFCVSATKQTTPIDGAFQKTTKQFCRASPETQFAQAASSYSKTKGNIAFENRERRDPSPLHAS